MPGSIISGIFGNKAAKVQAKAAKKGIESQEEMFERSVELSEPWRETGKGALGALGYELGFQDRPESYRGFEKTPGYDFQLDEGQKEINRSLAARGRSLSGPAVKEGMRFSQGLADQTYGNFLSRLANVAGLGEVSARQTGALAIETGRGIAGSQMDVGNARASGYVATGKAISGGINFLGKLAGFGF